MFLVYPPSLLFPIFLVNLSSHSLCRLLNMYGWQWTFLQKKRCYLLPILISTPWFFLFRLFLVNFNLHSMHTMFNMDNGQCISNYWDWFKYIVMLTTQTSCSTIYSIVSPNKISSFIDPCMISSVHSTGVQLVYI